MKKIFRVITIVVFFVGVLGLLANLATPFVFVYFKGLTFWNVLKAIALWGLFDLILALVATAGLLLNFYALNE